MYHDILLPTDGSPEAERATARALDLARTGDARLHLLAVVDTGAEPVGLDDDARDELRRDAEKRGRDATARLQERAADLDIEATRTVTEGVPHRAILDYIDEHGVDLVVMGTHGRSGADRARLGSTTERVVALAEVPVMAVRLDETGEALEAGYGMYDHVVVAVDGSDVAERAGEHALGIAERYGADVHVVYVVNESIYDLEDAPRSIVGLLKEGGEAAVESVAAAARERNLPVTADVLRGVPVEEVLAFATGVDADLVAMGTRGRGAATDGLLGSTTARVVRRSDIPVLTVS